jgi:ApbE superfamily uncharacterized protein (UPF0280 family)
VSEAQATFLPDGRLHLHHGPIDLVIEASGPGASAGYERAVRRFKPLLAELAAELPALRTDINHGPKICSPVGRAMAAAVQVFQPTFVTPMAAVAGAVADAVLAALAGKGIKKAYVNNGGDVAIHLTRGESFTAAVASEQPSRFQIRHDDPSRGIATSGWRGRSHSLGIADAVTVLATTAAEADAAATLIANAVNLPGHPSVQREPASELYPDSDLGQRLVTTGVGPLTISETIEALERGRQNASTMLANGFIHAAALSLNGEMMVV